MEVENTEIREIRVMNELLRKHGAGALAGFTGGTLPTIAALFIGWQTMTTKTDNVGEINKNLTDLTSEVQDLRRFSELANSNADELAQLRSDLNESDDANKEIKALVTEIAASQREIRRDLYYLARMLGGKPPPED